MRVDILQTNDDGDQESIGTFTLSNGRVYASSSKLDWILREPCRIRTGPRERIVTAVGSPEEWMKALPANYSGIRIRAKIV